MNSNGTAQTSLIGRLYQMDAIKRSVVIWLGFQAVLWFVFGIGYASHKEAWTNVIGVESATAAVGGWWTTLLYIILSNLLVCTLIVGGNLFVRFGVITPGFLVLAVQALMIGWVAGTNGFELPFLSVKAANMQYFRIGLWETTAYALACAVTLPKSLNIAQTFPAKEWSQTRRLRDVSLSTVERGLLLLGGVVLVGAAIVETFAIVG